VLIDIAGFRLIPEPQENGRSLGKEAGSSRDTAPANRTILGQSCANEVHHAGKSRAPDFPRLPIPLRLPFGGWWLAENGALDHELIYGEFERMEMEIVSRLLRRDMTVVDAGAHHGLYTLLASKSVGWDGRVIAIEPSPRECERLERHLSMNRCSNTALVPRALGEYPGKVDLYLVDGIQDWCNSLRPPAVDEPISALRVSVRRLDDVLAELGVTRVDFVKLDVEGRNSTVLYGAMKMPHKEPRPAILVEVRGIRTQPWG
jgi:FkbM family methyltransferase